MAGRKQHYIPQALLRGFKASQTGKHVQVYVFPAGREFYLSSTEGVASKRQFYSDLGLRQQQLNSNNDQFTSRLGFDTADRSAYWDALKSGLLSNG